jgi:hypothetical protein
MVATYYLQAGNGDERDTQQENSNK